MLVGILLSCDDWDFFSSSGAEGAIMRLRGFISNPPLSFGHLPLSGEESYFDFYLDRHGFASRRLSFRSLLGELSSIARLRGFNIQPVIASNSEAIQDDIHSFFVYYWVATFVSLTRDDRLCVIMNKENINLFFD